VSIQQIEGDSEISVDVGDTFVTSVGVSDSHGNLVSVTIGGSRQGESHSGGVFLTNSLGGGLVIINVFDTVVSGCDQLRIAEQDTEVSFTGVSRSTSVVGGTLSEAVVEEMPSFSSARPLGVEDLL